MELTDDSCLAMLSNLVESANKLKHPPDKETANSSSPGEKQSALEDFINTSEKKFLEVQDTIQNKAKFWFLLGRLYNCSEKFRMKGLEALCKAVKLDNDCLEAWNELGQCYWYSHNVDMARQCFERALEKGENKISIRNLSIVVRKQALIMDKEKRKENLTKATELAKRAVELDATDGISWSILGNSYLAEFFSGNQNHQSALLAIRAYKQAEKTLLPDDNYELYYNKGIALKYTEQFEESLEALRVSSQYDASWPFPTNAYELLLKYLGTIDSNYGKRGKLKTKKYWGMVSMVKALDEISLGPYRHDLDKFTLVQINDLQLDANPNKLLCGKVLWSLHVDCSFPLTIGLVDANGEEVVVTIFNLRVYKGFLIGDTVIIPNPQYSIVEVKHLDKVYNFKKIRVCYPPDLVVNGRKLPPSYYGKRTMLNPICESRVE